MFANSSANKGTADKNFIVTVRKMRICQVCGSIGFFWIQIRIYTKSQEFGYRSWNGTRKFNVNIKVVKYSDCFFSSTKKLFLATKVFFSFRIANFFLLKILTFPSINVKIGIGSV